MSSWTRSGRLERHHRRQPSLAGAFTSGLAASVWAMGSQGVAVASGVPANGVAIGSQSSDVHRSVARWRGR